MFIAAGVDGTPQVIDIVGQLSMSTAGATEPDQSQIGPKEKITDRKTPPVSDPTLCQMVRPIVQHVATLAEGAEVPQSVVGRVAIEMRGREHDARLPKPGRLDEIRPPGYSPTAIAPRGCPFVEPPPIRQAANEGEMRAPAALARTSGALEADAPA